MVNDTHHYECTPTLRQGIIEPSDFEQYGFATSNNKKIIIHKKQIYPFWIEPVTE